MSLDIRKVVADHEIDRFLEPIDIVFGKTPDPEAPARERQLEELDLRVGAFDEGTLVGSVGSLAHRMTVPGGVAVETSALTRVAVIPTHRRQGILTRMMRIYFDEAHRRGQVIGSLFASEGEIYGRYGFGMSAFSGDIELPRRGSAFVRAQGPEPQVRARFVDDAGAISLFAPIWDKVRLSTPGMIARSEAWWRIRRLNDRGGGPPLRRVLLEMNGEPCAYAIYRFSTGNDRYFITGNVDVVEAIGDSPASTRAIWRWLCDIDLVGTIKCPMVPADHPLVFLLVDPRQMRMAMADSIWARLIDVPAALSQRRYREGPPLVFDVADAFCPWNTGRYLLSNGEAERTERAPDLSLDIAALSSVYLGGFSFSQLALAGRVVEHTPGALRHGDTLFRGDRDPWSAEIY